MSVGCKCRKGDDAWSPTPTPIPPFPFGEFPTCIFSPGHLITPGPASFLNYMIRCNKQMTQRCIWIDINSVFPNLYLGIKMMGACGLVDRVLDSRSEGLTFGWSCVEIFGKLLILYYICPPSSDGYLVE